VKTSTPTLTTYGTLLYQNVYKVTNQAEKYKNQPKTVIVNRRLEF